MPPKLPPLGTTYESLMDTVPKEFQESPSMKEEERAMKREVLMMYLQGLGKGSVGSPSIIPPEETVETVSEGPSPAASPKRRKSVTMEGGGGLSTIARTTISTKVEQLRNELSASSILSSAIAKQQSLRNANSVKEAEMKIIADKINALASRFDNDPDWWAGQQYIELCEEFRQTTAKHAKSTKENKLSPDESLALKLQHLTPHHNNETAEEETARILLSELTRKNAKRKAKKLHEVQAERVVHQTAIEALKDEKRFLESVDVKNPKLESVKSETARILHSINQSLESAPKLTREETESLQNADAKRKADKSRLQNMKARHELLLTTISNTSTQPTRATAVFKIVLRRQFDNHWKQYAVETEELRKKFERIEDVLQRNAGVMKPIRVRKTRIEVREAIGKLNSSAKINLQQLQFDEALTHLTQTERKLVGIFDKTAPRWATKRYLAKTIGSWRETLIQILQGNPAASPPLDLEMHKELHPSDHGIYTWVGINSSKIDSLHDLSDEGERVARFCVKQEAVTHAVITAAHWVIGCSLLEKVGLDEGDPGERDQDRCFIPAPTSPLSPSPFADPGAFFKSLETAKEQSTHFGLSRKASLPARRQSVRDLRRVSTTHQALLNDLGKARRASVL